MSFIQAKPRTAQMYLAGIGASGALMASASVVFVILIGLVTLASWPSAGGLPRGGLGEVNLADNGAASAPAASAARGIRLAGLFPASAPGGRSLASNLNGGTRGGGGFPGGSPSAPSAPGGNEPPAQSPQPQPPPSQPRDAVSQAISDTGNAVQGGTDSVGNALGGTTNPSALGGVIGGVGRTLNSNLQSLAGG